MKLLHEKVTYIVKAGQRMPLGRVVEQSIVLLREGLADGFVLRVQSHL